MAYNSIQIIDEIAKSFILLNNVTELTLDLGKFFSHNY